MNSLLTADEKNPGPPRRIARLLRGERFSRFLALWGINPKQYWLLMDLFNAIGQRQEYMGQLGRQHMALRTIVVIYGLLMGFMSLAFAAAQMPPATYLLLFLAMTGFLLFSVVVSETCNTLVNPVEALILAHQPINGATYTAAKLAHILTILLYFVPGLNAIPAFAGLLLKPSRWSYPILHMAAAAIVGLLIVLFCCGMFGWLIRFVPAARLKGVARIAEFLPSLIFVFFAYAPRLARGVHLPRWLVPHRDLQIAGAVLMLGFAIAGIRCLSIDYLIRVSSMVHGVSRTRMRGQRRRSVIGDVVRRFCGGQAARAGFEFTRQLIARDWQFRRQLMALAPSLIMFAGALAGGWRTPPFSGSFSPMLVAPHFLGFVLLAVCPALVYGSDYKGIWVFLLAPLGALRKFAGGVHAGLWTLFIGAPHLALAGLLAFAWGPLDAALFAVFSAAMASLYLAWEIRLMEGIPFGKQLQYNRSFYMFGWLVLFATFAGVVLALQYLLVFRSRPAVVIVTAVVAAAAWAAGRASLEVVATAMRHQLGTLSEESTLLYREID